ncbi:MAG: hypothetical protein HKM05_05615 [Spirochaetales bacterium]|nr:hypothetical protein [Spirochaetales bacterium]
MKRMISVLTLAGFAAMAWAQSTTTSDNALADQVKELAANASKLKISGYAVGAESFSPADWQAKSLDYVDVLNKQQKNGSFARMMLTYDSKLGGFNSRFEYDPNNATIIAMKYAEAYAKLFDAQVLVGAGMLRDTDFAYKSQVASDFNTNLFTGAINTNAGFPAGTPYSNSSYVFNGGKWAATGGFFSGQQGEEVLYKPSFAQGLELGLVSNSQTTGNGAVYLGNITSSLSYLAAYTMKDLGDIKVGYTGAANSNSWSNFFVTVDAAPAQVSALKVSLSLESLNISVDKGDGQSHSSMNLFATAGYDFSSLGAKGLWLGEDFGMFTSASTFGILTEDKPGVSSSTRLQYTFANVAPSFNIIPMLTYRVFDYMGTSTVGTNPGSGFFSAGSYSGIEPAVQIVAGPATFAFGWGHYMGTTINNAQPAADVISVGTLYAY